jgi:hypothetical protein
MGILAPIALLAALLFVVIASHRLDWDPVSETHKLVRQKPDLAYILAACAVGGWGIWQLIK